MHGPSCGTLLCLTKLHLQVFHVVDHPLRLLLTLAQLSLELTAALHLQETADTWKSHTHTHTQLTEGISNTKSPKVQIEGELLKRKS